MKKIFLMLISALTISGVAYAQEQTPEEQLNAALELANQGNDAFAADSPELALEAFQASLKMVEGLELEGAISHAETCKTAICNLYMALAKNIYREQQWDAAVTAFEKAKDVATGYGNQDVVAEAETLIISAKANTIKDQAEAAKQNKDYATAASLYKQMVDMDPDNGAYLFQLGDAYYRMKDWDNAVLYLEQAKVNGQERNADNRLSTVYVYRCQASLKAKNYQEALDLAYKSLEYKENANALKLGASAARSLNKLAVCEELYLKYLALVPNAKDAGDIKLTLAATYQKVGNKAKAKEYYQMLVSDPKHGATAKQQLGTLK